MRPETQRSILEQARRSTRLQVTRASIGTDGLPIDLAPVAERLGGRRGRLVVRTASVLLVLGVLLTAYGTIRGWRPFAAAPVAVVEVGGEGLSAWSRARRSTAKLALASGSSLYGGAVIETGARPAALRLRSGASLRLDAGSRVRLETARVAQLERGAVYFDSRREPDAGVEVRTRFGMVRDIGTQFEVRLRENGEEGSMQVRVREGKVVVRQAQDRTEAVAGEVLEVTADGRVSRALEPPHGTSWRWVVATAPVPQIEGLDLRTLLEWFAREGGWTVRYGDPRLANGASSIVLHGDADGLSAPDAVTMALRGSGLGYRVDDAVLVVERSGEPADSAVSEDESAARQ